MFVQDVRDMGIFIANRHFWIVLSVQLVAARIASSSDVTGRPN